MGQVKQLGFDESGQSFDMIIHSPTVLQDVNLGDRIRHPTFRVPVGLALETLRKTSLIELEKGSAVNLGRAVKPSTRMGGHFVQRHVDGTGEIVSMDPEGFRLNIWNVVGEVVKVKMVVCGFCLKGEEDEDG
ncbi:riboflavin synthase-like protein [Tanacetum coccineum]